ncbi:lipopolysaccharide-binding protein-like isoform X2 [Tamandua tetradactyla]|uniref:lipopolysaccharide-binding protein-like isoform X2 n=1 Tax=Tamandua tetradactyla TaxID=48850 RepID=UPI004053E719
MVTESKSVVVWSRRCLRRLAGKRKELRTRMAARLYCVVVALLLLAEVYSFGEETSDPGIVARITRKGLKYARHHGLANLKKELSKIRLHDFLGKFRISWIGWVHYEFHSLKIQHFTLGNSDLSLNPQKGLGISLSNSYISVHGIWKVKKAFIPVAGTFNLSLDSISTSFSLNFSKDNSGRPTVSMTHCNNSVGNINIDLSKTLRPNDQTPESKTTESLSVSQAGHREGQRTEPAEGRVTITKGIQTHFHEIVEKKLIKILDQKICGVVRTAVTSRLQPYLRTLPVSTMIDYVASIDYRLVGVPKVSFRGLDTPFKGEFFSRKRHTPAPTEVPAIEMPQKKSRMVYFAVSDYVFNTASWVYQQARQMHFNIETTQIPLNAPIHLNTNSFQTLVPQLGKLYPNMKMELDVAPESTPFLIFNPGNASLMAVMVVQAYALRPKTSDHIPLFQLRAKTTLYPTFNVISGRIVGFVNTGSPLKLELKQSNVDSFDVRPMETILNYYAQHTIYPSLNEKLEEGLPLPLPKAAYLRHVVVRIHENFLYIGANLG